VADDDPRPLPDLVHIGGQSQAQGLDAEQIDLLLQDPARVVLAEPRGLDQRQGLVLGRIGAQVGAGLLHREPWEEGFVAWL